MSGQPGRRRFLLRWRVKFYAEIVGKRISVLPAMFCDRLRPRMDMEFYIDVFNVC